MSKQGFDKFINKKSPAKVKEEHRQEKRKSKAALRAAGDEMRRAKAEKARGIGASGHYDSRSARVRPTDQAAFGGQAGKTKGKYDRNSTRGKAPVESDLDTRKANPNFGLKNERYASPGDEKSELMPLNKFIAHSGICGRREAAEMVKQGHVQVNGDIVFEPATKVSQSDTIKLKGKKINIQQKLVYFLLNKPKDHITTTKDDKGRKTVLDLFKGITDSHLFPVGRLDRNTTGVLLLTNDGELAQQLTHPSFEVKKIYEATLDRPLAKKDAEAIASGITLEDGEIKADRVGYADPKNKAVIGIEIHSGKNRIVRRIFEHLGYEVKKLDRVMFAGLTKKNVDRGKWRYLAEKEIRILKFMNAGGAKKSPAAKAKSKALQKEALQGSQLDTAVDKNLQGVPKTRRKRIAVPGRTDHVKPKAKTAAKTDRPSRDAQPLEKKRNPKPTTKRPTNRSTKSQKK